MIVHKLVEGANLQQFSTITKHTLCETYFLKKNYILINIILVLIN